MCDLGNLNPEQLKIISKFKSKSLDLYSDMMTLSEKKLIHTAGNLCIFISNMNQNKVIIFQEFYVYNFQWTEFIT